MRVRLAEIEAAADLVRPVVAPTAQIRWPLLARRCGCEVWVKHENHTPIGAFKVRGGLVYLDAIAASGEAPREVVLATRGNHGQSIPFAAARHGIRSLVVVPHGNSREKNRAMEALGARLVEHGETFDEAFDHARRLAEERDLPLVPSFHELLVRGVATWALELLRAVPDLDTLYVPIGLGSGICGAIAVRDELGLATRIVGVVAEQAPTHERSFAARRAVPAPVGATVADGVATGRPHPEALEAMLAGVDRVVEVAEPQIRAAMRHYFSDTHNVAEGAGAIGLAALLREGPARAGAKVGLVLTGGNVDREVFAEILAGNGTRGDDV